MTVENKTHNHKILGKPVLGAILVMLGGSILCDGLGAIVSEINELIAYVVAIAAGIIVMLLHKFHFRPELKSMASLSFFKDRSVMIVAIVFVLIDIIIVSLDCARLGFVLPGLTPFFGALMAGVTEEVVFRVLPVSVMMRAYKDRNKYMPALLFPAIVFGLIHIQNLLAGANFGATVVQVISATIAGIFFAAIYLRTGSIVLPVFIHFLHDYMNVAIATQASSFVVTASPGVIDTVEMCIIAAVQMVMVVIMLKGHKKDIMDKWHEIWNAHA